MILDPLGHVPVEIELRTATARGAWRAQPRRVRRPRRLAIDWDRLRHRVAHAR